MLSAEQRYESPAQWPQYRKPGKDPNSHSGRMGLNDFLGPFEDERHTKKEVLLNTELEYTIVLVMIVAVDCRPDADVSMMRLHGRCGHDKE